MIGKNLLHYSVERRLGSGGMGEVYMARDTRLGRSVAVKVLPEAFAQDPERIARLQREAKVLASLNHTNIAALYGLEEFEKRHFLVMELVEGETLAERIAHGRIAVDEALRIALQIAEALESAHEKEVVHRDLKMANVMITPEGKVKVLDFGLAKAMEGAPQDVSLSNSPTLSAAGTNPGVILGTPAYMSPEQANGLKTDPRSDIFSFGSVLYEMLTGRQAFQGDTVSELLASVLAREPDLNALPANLNPRIPDLLRRCLEKNPKRRWRAVADTRAEIEAILADPRGVVVQAQTAAPQRPLWKRAIPVVLGVVGGVVIASVVAWNLRPIPPPTIVTRFPFTIPEAQQFSGQSRQVLAISPDGAQFAYAANNRLFLKSMSEPQPIFIQGTDSAEGLQNPVFSPDGRSLAFWSVADRSLKRIAVSGGAPVTICQADAPYGVSWGTNNELVFGQAGKGIMRVSANGGTPDTIVSLKDDEIAYGAQVLPGGDAVLFSLALLNAPAITRWDTAQIVVQSLKSGERKTLIEGGGDGRYVRTGHIIYALGATLLAVPFDVDQLQVTGGPVPIIEGVRRGTPSAFGIAGTTQFSFSNTGSLVYVAGTSNYQSLYQLATVDRNGSIKPIGLPPAAYRSARISPDGKQLAIDTDDGKEQVVWVYELSGTSSMRRLTFGASTFDPLWSGDGKRIVFSLRRDGYYVVYWQPADGTGTAEPVIEPETGTSRRPQSWSPQDERFSYLHNKGGDSDMWTYSLRDKKAAPFVAIPSSRQAHGNFSRDGKWMAYESNETGRLEIYAQPFPATGAKFQITRDGGEKPLWSPDGKELFYVNNGRLYSVGVRTEPTFTFANPAPLPIIGFQQLNGPQQRQYDITPDGKQFIMLFPPERTTTEAAPAPQIQVVLNWFEELKQRMAAQ